MPQTTIISRLQSTRWMAPIGSFPFGVPPALPTWTGSFAHNRNHRWLMREFFRPFRRKLGVIALVVACVLMAGWVRSQSTHDSYFVSHKSWMRSIESRSGSMHWITFDLPGSTNDNSTEFGSVPVRASDPDEVLLRRYAPVTRMSFLGLSFSEGSFFSISTVK